MVPEGWVLSTLGTLGRWSGGGTPSKAVPEYWENGDIPWISPKDMGTARITQSEDYITQAAVEGSSTKVYPAGSVLVVTRSGILRKRVPVALSLVPVAVNQDIKVLPLSNGISNEFVANFMWCYNEAILSRCAKDGTTVESIDTASLLEFPIKLPPLPEQKKIVQILSTWDKAIAASEELLAYSQLQKKALMQQLLTGKKRLLDETGARFSGVWREHLLGNIAEITTGSSNRQDSNLTGDFTFFDRSVDIRTSNHYLFDAEAIIVPGEGQQFTPKYFVGKFDLHQRTYAIMNFPSCFGKFLYYTLSHFNNYLLSQAVGSTVKSLRLPMFKKMKLLFPSFEEQRKIAGALTSADAEIAGLRKKLEYLREEKTALMQELLSGKRRAKS